MHHNVVKFKLKQGKGDANTMQVRQVAQKLLKIEIFARLWHIYFSAHSIVSVNFLALAMIYNKIVDIYSKFKDHIVSLQHICIILLSFFLSYPIKSG